MQTEKVAAIACVRRARKNAEMEHFEGGGWGAAGSHLTVSMAAAWTPLAGARSLGISSLALAAK